ncbi:alpha/beta fold hydrolase [Sediminibacillus massiliensis]|uniref:alpha/beta fold hydrolase n=1 Tax=Sediminibacillus massiliensis TaxID=1926277 RepID=UPI0009888F05|nr:alpha/beta fold hydrolase [Sediminibacillus massiliensis]
MDKTHFWLEMPDNQEVFIREWKPASDDILAVVQISHGMVEHSDRYDAFASFLADKGIAVYANDHRGHGLTGKKQGTMGLFAPQSGFETAAEDLHQITKYIKEQHTETPIFLLGHSMGSFLARRYIQNHSSFLDGIILSGTGSHPGPVTIPAKWIALREAARKGISEPSPLLNKLTFGSFNKHTGSKETGFEWLTRDKEQIRTYVDDPMTGFTPTASFFYDLFSGFDLIDRSEYIDNISKSLPFLFITGTKDPVGKETKGVFKVMDRYYKHGLTNIIARFYEEGRHEMLNETNKEEVYEDIHQWIKHTLHKNSPNNE